MSRHTAVPSSQASVRPVSRIAALLAVALLLVVRDARADVLLVDPSNPIGFAQIQPAIDAALPGDVILIRPLQNPNAVYDPFSIVGKQLALVGEITLGTVRVAAGEISQIPDGAVVMVRQLDFVGTPDTPGLVVEAGDGWVRLENLNITGGDGANIGPGAGLVVSNSDSVVATYCNIKGGNAVTGGGSAVGARGIDSHLSHLSVRGGSLLGGNGAAGTPDVAGNGGRGGDAAWITGGFNFLSTVAVVAGDGGLASCEPGGGCICGVSGDGGDGVSMHNANLVLENIDAVPGNSPEGGCGPTGSSGQQTVTVGGSVLAVDSPVHDYWMSAPLQTPKPAKFHYKGEEGEAIIISAGAFPMHFFTPKFDGDMYISQSNLLDFYFLRFLDSTGVHDTGHPVSDPPPGIDSFMGYTQGFFVAPGNKLYCGPLSLMIYIGYGP
jgi:hypothetical protein